MIKDCVKFLNDEEKNYIFLVERLLNEGHWFENLNRKIYFNHQF
jgi:hypothetical protein